MASGASVTGTRTVLVGMFNILVALGLGRFLFPVAAPLMHRELGASFTEIGFFASLILAGYLAFSYVGGVAIHHFGRREVIVPAFAILSVAFILPFAGSGIAFLAAAFLMMGAAAGAVYVGTFSTVNAFIRPERQGRSMGVIFAGAGLGIAAIGTAVRFANDDGGVLHVAWGVSAAVAALASALNWLFFDRTPARAASRGAGVGRYRDAWKVIVRDPFLARITVAYLLYGASYASYLTYVFSNVSLHDGPAAASDAWILFGLTSIASTVGWGRAYDHFGATRSVAANYGLTLVAVALSLAPGGATLRMASVLLYGLCFLGYISSIGGIITRETRVMAPVYMGKLTLIHTVGQILGALGGGVVADATGSFRGVFAFSLLTLVVSLGCFAALPPASSEKGAA